MEKQPKNKVILGMDLGKVPPQAIDLEEAILGAVLLENNSIKLIDYIKPEVFYKEAHQKIFKAALDLLENGNPIDLLTVGEQLRKTKQLEEIGGPYYISQLTNRVASSANIEYHARIIYEKFIQRGIIRITEDIHSKCYDDSIDLGDLIDFAKSSLDFKLEFTSKLQTLEDCKLSIDDQLNKPPALLQVLQGVNSIPICKRGNITTLKGKGKAGKTTTASLITAAVIAQGKFMDKFYCPFNNLKVVIFDTEESRYDALSIVRMICRLRGIERHPKNLVAFSLKKFSPKERIRYIRNYIYNNEVDFVLLDGVRDLVRNKNSEEEATDISHEIGRWNEDRNFHILCLIHENKGDYNATGHLGTEMNNKAESVISSTREQGDTKIFTISDDFARGRENFDSISWKYENGLPVLTQYQKTQNKINKQDEDLPF